MKFKNSVIQVALVEYGNGYRLLGATHLVDYLSS